MLDNTENQRLHERIAEVAAFLPGLGSTDCPAFNEDKLQRILNRVYERIANDAVEPADPRWRQQLAEVVAHLELNAIAFPESKMRRILDRVETRLDADAAVSSVIPSDSVKPAPKLSALARLRSAAVALFMLRHLSFEPRSRPLPDGPTD
jgi:hypothetical protein